MLNDTGSSYRLSFDTDLACMGGNEVAYGGYGPFTVITTANGDILRQKNLLEIKLLHLNPQCEFPTWIREVGVITPAAECQMRLSGLGVRRRFFFGTSPSNNLLIVAERKTDLCLQLQR